MRYRDCFCASCGVAFQRYAMNATRAAMPQYCCPECFSAGMEKRAQETAKARLFSYILFGDENECWGWQGRRDPRGYGRFDFRRDPRGYGRFDFRIPGDKRAKPWLAHRVAYEMMVGRIDEGLVVCHSCDNPPCCNPKHHFVGTQADNVADMIAKGRWRPPEVRRGSRVNTSKLIESQVVEIIHSPLDASDLATKFSVTPGAIRPIKSGKNWAHVQRTLP